LCKGYPDEFILFINYSRGLQFEEKPDYNYLRNLFKAISIKFNFEIDQNFDWNEGLKYNKTNKMDEDELEKVKTCENTMNFNSFKQSLFQSKIK